jgi:hypothetical protein
MTPSIAGGAALAATGSSRRLHHAMQPKTDPNLYLNAGMASLVVHEVIQ